MKNFKAQIGEYVRKGWKIFPIHTIFENGECSCGKPKCPNVGKHPIGGKGFYDGTDDIDKIADWIEKYNGKMNIGLSTGRLSMVVVLDIDEKDAYSGAEALEALEDKYHRLPTTLTQTTGSGGKHYFFNCPTDVDIPSSNNKIADGIDIRGNGGYAIVPPSNHSSGSNYRWNNWGTSIADMPKWLIDLSIGKTPIDSDKVRKLVEKKKVVAEGGRNNHLTKFAARLRGMGVPDEEILSKTIDENQRYCKPPLSSSEVDTIYHSILRYPTNREREVGGWVDFIEDSVDEDDIELSEQGNGFRLASAFRHEMLYCHAKHKWFIYDGHRWEENNGQEERNKMTRVIQAMKRQAATIENEDAKKRCYRWILKSEEVRVSLNSIRAAQPLLNVKVEQFDSIATDFNCLNGTFSLESFKMRPHDYHDIITFIANVEYDKSAKCPLWISHMGKVFDGNKDTIESFQRICGYSLIEDNPQQCMFIAWGIGKNGKSTTFNVLSNILGDYAANAQAESFMKTNHGEGRNDIARLNRKRLVVTTEPPQGAQLNATLVKSATGGDKLPVRFLYQEHFEMVPKFKLFMHTNHRPHIPNSDEGIWRRIKMIPFDHVFSEEERDTNIEAKLIEESSGILNWMIQGYKKYIEDGSFKESQVMIEATKEYRSVEDVMEAYIQERCTIEPDASVGKTDIFADFIEWCEEAGEEKCSIKRFAMLIKGGSHKDSIKEERSAKGGRRWKGIGIKNPMESATDRLKKIVQHNL